MLLQFYKSFKKDKILNLLFIILLIISTSFYISLNLSSNTLNVNYHNFSLDYHKNQFMIIPDYNKIDQIIDNVTFYEFDNYYQEFQNSSYKLDFDNMKNINNYKYLTDEQINFIESNINDNFINNLYNSDKPSLYIYYPIKKIIYNNINYNIPNSYKENLASIKAKEYTKLLLLLTLNEDNYFKFIEFTLDNRLLAKNENNDFLPSTYAYKYNLTIDKKIVKHITSDLSNKKVNYFITTKQTLFNTPFILDTLYDKSNLILNENEVAIFKEFADKNKLKLGDYININDKIYKIVSFVYLPDSIYPILDLNQYYYNTEIDTIVLVNENVFNNYKQTNFNSIIYTAKFNDTGDNFDKQIKNLNNDFREDNLYLISQYNSSDSLIKTNISNLNILSYSLSISILLITIIFMIILLSRKINNEEKEIGILKALGYYNKEIIRKYVIFYLILTFIGIILGFISGIILSKIILAYFYKLFLIPYKRIHFNVFMFLLLSLPIFIVFFICLFIGNLKLHKKTISLINACNNLYIKKHIISPLDICSILLNICTLILSYIVFKITNKLDFLLLLISILLIYLIYFIYAKSNNFINKTSRKIGSRNIKKLLSFNITIFFTSLLFCFAFFSINVYKDIKLNIIRVRAYEEYITYSNFLNLTTEDLKLCNFDNYKCEGFFSSNFYVLNVNNKKNINEEIIFNGYREEVTMFKVIDNSLIQNNDIIITKPLADKYNIKIKDSIVLVTNKIVEDNIVNKYKCQFNEKLYCETQTVYVKGIAYNLTGYAIYTNISNINYWYYGDNNHSNHINTIYTNFNPSSINIQKFSNNILFKYKISDILNELNHVFYSMIIITNISFILIIIISVILLLIIMELTITENLSQIVLLKSLGYKNKEINKLVINFYKPYILKIFLLTYPISYIITNKLYFYFSLKMNKSLVVNINYIYIMLVILLLYIIYYITSYLSFIRLKHISLATNLKK